MGRSPYDFYPTPSSAIKPLLEKMNFHGVHIYEPCAGDGAIVKEIKNMFPDAHVSANELDTNHEANLSLSGADRITWTNFLTTKDNGADIIITNPPFSLAQEFLEYTFENYSAPTVIMLLRLNFLASQKRHDFWKKYPPTHLYVLSKRPSFTGSGTDSQDYAWFVWERKNKDTRIEVIK